LAAPQRGGAPCDALPALEPFLRTDGRPEGVEDKSPLHESGSVDKGTTGLMLSSPSPTMQPPGFQAPQALPLTEMRRSGVVTRQRSPPKHEVRKTPLSGGLGPTQATISAPDAMSALGSLLRSITRARKTFLVTRGPLSLPPGLSRVLLTRPATRLRRAGAACSPSTGALLTIKARSSFVHAQ
jgi:hypothetical protein